MSIRWNILGMPGGRWWFVRIVNMSTLRQSMVLAWMVVSFSGTASAQIPRINSFSPLAGPTGTVVTISGTNFSSLTNEDIIFVGGVRAEVLSASGNALMARVPVGANYAPLTVTRGGVTASANAPFIVTFDSSRSVDANSFADKMDFAAAGNPRNLAVVDVDGDGKPDLVVANDGTPSISVFKNTSSPGNLGGNAFAAKVDFATGSRPLQLAVGDLDGDGKPDLVVANWDSGTISVFQNTSTPGTVDADTFANRIDLATGPGPYSVAIGDLDGDGWP